MTFDECDGATVTRKQALREIKRHAYKALDEMIAEFDAEVGVCEQYDAMAVLIWLGY